MAHAVEDSEHNSSAGSIQEKTDIEKACTPLRLCSRHGLLIYHLAVVPEVQNVNADFDDPNIDKEAILLGTCSYR